VIFVHLIHINSEMIASAIEISNEYIYEGGPSPIGIPLKKMEKKNKEKRNLWVVKKKKKRNKGT
jgi:hypothetical protein